MTRRVIGADGCAVGWVVVLLVDGAVADVEVVDALTEALAPPVDAAGIDMPIGLVDGRRDADVAARRLLPGRTGSVFSAPPRCVVDGYRDGSICDHAAATELATAVTGVGLSLQAWRLVPKIAAVDDLLAAGHELLEVHPEVAFAAVVGDVPPPKRSWGGITTRRSILARHGVHLPDRFPGDEHVAPDDVVDAAVCAWVADAAAAGLPLLQVPDATDQIDRGRRIVITARPAPPVAPGRPRRPGR